MNRSAALFAIAFFAAAPAVAWDSTCVKYGNTLYGASDAAKRICAGSDSTTACSTAQDEARGVRVGEHALLASRGLAAAGLATLVSAQLPSYATTGTPFGTGASVTPGVPGVLGSSSSMLRHRTTLPELAEVPDASYGLADFLLGNEHCFARGAVSSDATRDRAARGTADGATTCHDFSSRMGSVNSTHFGPQAKASYVNYHALALQVAGRCRADVAKLPASDAYTAKVASACELEAMALEVTGQHYLQDSWSSGHMWQRWGTPLFETTADGRVRQQVVAMLSGLIHGWRSLAQDYAVVSYWKDDQLCMPGFFSSYTPAEEARHTSELVRFGFPASATRYAAGGDDYLLSCTAFKQSERWAVASTQSDSPLRPQYRRLLTCSARGVAEIYEAGPKTAGARRNEDVLLESGIRTSLDDGCWAQRVTNQSMVLGSAVSTLARLDDPALITRWAIERLPWMASTVTTETISDATWTAIRDRLRVDFAAYGLAIRQAAALRPEGLDAADLATTPLLGFGANGQQTATVTGGAVTYMEKPQRAQWVTSAVTACTGDGDCASDSYCEGSTTAPSAGRCVLKEQAILRVFRHGEVAHWCAADTASDLAALSTACRSGRSADACTTCIEWARPHAKSVAAATTCASLGVSQSVVIGTGIEASADASASKFCRGN